MAAAWDRGERMTAAEILERHPDLDTEAAIRLIYEEVCLRREAGLVVDTDGRPLAAIPGGATRLQDLLDCDRLLSPSGACGLPGRRRNPRPVPPADRAGPGWIRAGVPAAEPSLADRPVVLKVIPGDQDEHLALARLRHTHIVPLFSEHFFPDRNLRVLCMPYLGGASLAQIVNELADVAPGRRSGNFGDAAHRNTHDAHPAPPRRPVPAWPGRGVVYAGNRLGRGLPRRCALPRPCHGVVHMDIKPSNVLIMVDGQPCCSTSTSRGPIGPATGRRPARRDPRVDVAGATNGDETVDEGRPPPSPSTAGPTVFALGLLLSEAHAVPVSDQVLAGADPAQRRPDVMPGWATSSSSAWREIRPIAIRQRPIWPTTSAVTSRTCPCGVGNRSPIERWRKWRRRRPGALAWAVTGLTIVLAAAIATGVFADGYRQRLPASRNALTGVSAPAASTMRRSIRCSA